MDIFISTLYDKRYDDVWLHMPRFISFKFQGKKLRKRL